MFTKEYIYNKILASFNDKNVSGDMAELVANILSEYAFCIN